MVGTSVVLSANGISKRYRDLIFSNFTWEFPSSGMFVIKGPNGSGKSTLLRVLACMEPPDSGEVRLMGEVVRDFRAKVYHKYAKVISFSFQEPALLPISVEKNLKIPTLVDESKLEKIIDELGLRKLLKSKATKISGGEKKRTDLARALSRKTPVLLADEPLSFLDPEYVEVVTSLLREEAAHRLVIATTTGSDQLTDSADAVIDIMDYKRI